MEHTKISSAWPFVLGLLSTILSIALATFPYIALILGIIGLVLAVKIRRTDSGSLVMAGFILSIIGIVISGVELIVWVSCVGIIASIADAASYYAGSEMREALDALWDFRHMY